MADIEYLKKIDARIAELVAAKNAELNSESLEAGLALESNVREGHAYTTIAASATWQTYRP